MPFPRPCGATGNDAQKLHTPAFALFRGAARMHEVLRLCQRLNNAFKLHAVRRLDEHAVARLQQLVECREQRVERVKRRGHNGGVFLARGAKMTFSSLLAFRVHFRSIFAVIFVLHDDTSAISHILLLPIRIR